MGPLNNIGPHVWAALVISLASFGLSLAALSMALVAMGND